MQGFHGFPADFAGFALQRNISGNADPAKTRKPANRRPAFR